MDSDNGTEFSNREHTSPGEQPITPATSMSDKNYSTSGTPGVGAEYGHDHNYDRNHDRNYDANEGWFERLSAPLYESRGWLKFLSVVSVAVGVLQALTIIGILWAWLPIWCGILLWQAAESAERARLGNDAIEFEQCLRKVKTIVTMFGVVAIISIAFSFLGFMFMILTGGLAVFSEYLNGL